jgi:predicted aspartyl protease
MLMKILIDVSSGKRIIRDVEAVIDTGCTLGLVLPMRMARKLGTTFLEGKTRPRTVDGTELVGEKTILNVDFPDGDVGDKTLVFCPEEDIGEVLIGILWLRSVGMSMAIGDITLRPPRSARANAREKEPYDLSHHIIPLDRPGRPWSGR